MFDDFFTERGSPREVKIWFLECLNCMWTSEYNSDYEEVRHKEHCPRCLSCELKVISDFKEEW